MTTQSLYYAIHLHSNNSVIAVLDATDKVIYKKRLPNNCQNALDVVARPIKPKVNGQRSSPTIAVLKGWSSNTSYQAALDCERGRAKVTQAI